MFSSANLAFYRAAQNFNTTNTGSAQNIILLKIRRKTIEIADEIFHPGCLMRDKEHSVRRCKSELCPEGSVAVARDDGIGDFTGVRVHP